VFYENALLYMYETSLKLENLNSVWKEFLCMQILRYFEMNILYDKCTTDINDLEEDKNLIAVKWDICV